MSKNYFQVVQRVLWKSNIFSGLNIEGITMGNSVSLLVQIWFLTGVLSLDISYYKVTCLKDVVAAPANPAFSIRNE